METAILRHLVESTAVAGLAALVAVALGGSPARVRYWIWMAASLKFAVPFALLVTMLATLGARVEWTPASPVVRPEVAALVEQISQPMALPAAAVADAPRGGWMPAAAGAIWLSGFAGVWIFWMRRSIEVRRALRGAKALELDGPLRAMTSRARIEPGIFGILRPVLLLPEGLAERLSAEQLQAIVVHEQQHARRRDNLTAAMHMLVESIFWFHPLVWWIGARLIEERELACDEGVLGAGKDRQAYAAGILEVCKFYLESPLPCAAGVTGADLKKRIGSILNGPAAREMGASAKLLLAASAALGIGGPVLIGLAAPQLRAQSLFTTPYNGPGFEVASIKPSDPAQRGSGIPPPQGGRFRAVNVRVRELLGYAYHTAYTARIAGGPGWLDSDRYDVVAKAAGDVPEAKVRPMVLKLLQDRFALKFHNEQKQMQAYVLSVAKGGPKVKISNNCHPDPERKQPCGGFRVQNRRYIGGQQVSAADLAEVLEALIGAPVIDRTGIDGVFDMTLEWTPDERQSPGGDAGVAAPSTDKPSLYVAIQEQLGLRLDLRKMMVDTIVVDAASKPTEN